MGRLTQGPYKAFISAKVNGRGVGVGVGEGVGGGVGIDIGKSVATGDSFLRSGKSRYPIIGIVITTKTINNIVRLALEDCPLK